MYKLRNKRNHGITLIALVITIGENVTSIGENAFTNNPNLESATIKSGSIGNYIFNACGKLKTINIGKGVSSIASNAFENQGTTSSIQTIIIEKDSDLIVPANKWGATNATIEKE